MIKFFENNCLISERQFGFSEGKSADQLSLQLVNKIRHLLTLDESRAVTLAALNIRKAFDCINHDILIDKLISCFNFGGDASAFIKNYLTQRSQAMKINGVISSMENIVTGVPRGSVHGPLLSIAFINDLTELENCFLFADDCLLIAGGKNPSLATAKMENHISNAFNWYQQKLLTMNSSKTNVMTISKDKEMPPNLSFQNQSFKQVDKIKYLGVVLDNNLNFKRHVSKLKPKFSNYYQFWRALRHFGTKA